MERRRLPIAGPLSPMAIAKAAHVALAAHWKRSKGAGAAADAARTAEDWFDDLGERVAKEAPPRRALACQAGCAHCCHLKVGVTAPEAIALATHLRARLDEAALAALREGVRAADARTRGMTTDARLALKLPCPLLDAGGRCVGYEARPLACRSATSYDARACERALAQPRGPVRVEPYEPLLHVASALRASLHDTAEHARLDGAMLELNAALALLLDDETRADAWAKGRRDALLGARDDEHAKAAFAAQRR